MRYTLPAALLTMALHSAYAALPIPGDPSRGAQIFKQYKCVACHAVDGEGGKSAPDLGKRNARAYTPTAMASAMWNHAAGMWTAMQKAGIRRPQLTVEQVADLFAYFAQGRYFDPPGDAGRGKTLWKQKGCAACHGIGSPAAGGIKAVRDWGVVNDPIALAQAMWNHSTAMTSAMNQKKAPRPVLTSQDLSDILVFLQNQPGAKGLKGQFAPASAETGKMLFAVKGCEKCHSGKNTLVDKVSGRSMTDFAAAMWNHGPKMGVALPELRSEEMRRLVGYLWSIQYFEPRGDAGRGKLVWERKLCASCHDVPQSGAPDLKAKGAAFSSFSMVAGLWQHGEGMLGRMAAKKQDWQRMTPSEVSDLIAYLSSAR